MGKDRHSKDKLWITYSEHTHEWGGKKNKKQGEKFEKLPFYCCALSLLPFKTPVCTRDGIIFDLLYIIPYIKKYKKNPITGEALTAGELIKLKMHKNTKGQYHCPITYKIFTDFTHIIAIPETGNVFSYDAYKELNKLPKNYKDLLTEAPFNPKTLITIQDPKQNRANVTEFDYFNSEEKYDFIRAKVEEDRDHGKVNIGDAQKRILEQLHTDKDSESKSSLNKEEQKIEISKKEEEEHENSCIKEPVKKKKKLEMRELKSFRIEGNVS